MAEQIDLEWRMVEEVVVGTIETARARWPVLLNELPMKDEQKNLLVQ
jgi:hypothetical protein